MAQRKAVLARGKVQAAGTSRELKQRPAEGGASPGAAGGPSGARFSPFWRRGWSVLIAFFLGVSISLWQR